ncbi:MAG: hypothetical protein U0232_19090 [Thermomicrobiales bacterium]
MPMRQREQTRLMSTGALSHPPALARIIPRTIASAARVPTTIPFFPSATRCLGGRDLVIAIIP